MRKRKPTARHHEIAEIARHLGTNVSAQDVKIVFEATRTEYENRTDKPAASGKARHNPFVWGGLKGR